MGKSSSQIIGYRHYLGVECILFQGAIDYLYQMRYADRQCLLGNYEPGQATVSQPNLLGGDEREGGISGTLDIQDGDAAQTVNSYLSSKRSAPLSALRGVSSLIFRSFYWGNNPYLKDWMVTAQRIRVQDDGSEQWYVAKAEIPSDPITDEIGITAVATPNEPTLPLANTVAALPHMTWGQIGATAPTITKQTTSVTRNVIGVPTDFEVGDEGYFLFGDGGSFQVVDFRIPYRFTDGNVPLGYSDLEVRVTFESCSGDAIGSGGILQSIQAIDDNSTIWSTTYNNPANTPGQSYGSDWRSVDSGWQTVPAGLTGVYFRLQRQTEEVGVRNVVIQFRGDLGATPNDMNPAHIIREALTNSNWGIGASTADIDDTAFTAAADALYTEGFGLTLLHDPENATAWDLIQTVLDHVDGVFYVDRTTGKYVFRLVRDDYGSGDITDFTEADILSVDVTQEQPHELSNRVTLTYYDRDRRDRGTITVNNIPRIQQTGRSTSASLDRIGIHKRSLASQVAQRDLVTLSTPKKRGTVVLTRKASGLHPGDVISLTHSQYGLAGEIMRVLEVDEGDGRSNQVRVQFVEDIFALSSNVFVSPDDPVTPIDKTPQDVTVKIVQEAPYLELVREIGDSAAQDALTEDPALGFLHVSAGAPTGASLSAAVWAAAPTTYSEEDFLNFAPYGTITSALTQDPTDDDIVLATASGVDGIVAVGDLAQIGTEIVVVRSISGNNITLGRGCLDTVPVAHSAGASIVFWDKYAARVTEEYADGETVNVKLLTNTGTGQLAIADATAATVVMDRRAYRPYAPGKLQLAGSYLPSEVVSGQSLTWAHRDRLTQTGGTVYDFTEGNLGPEAGTTYRIDYFAIDGDGVEAGSAYYSTTTGTTSHTMSSANYSGSAPSDAVSFRVKVTAVRDTYDSFQSPSFVLPLFEVFATEDGDPFMTEDGENFLSETAV